MPALGAGARQHRLLRPGELVEIIEDERALDQRLAVVEHQRRHAAQRIIGRDLVGVAEGRPRSVLEGEAVKPQRNRDAADEGGVVLADQEHGFALLWLLDEGRADQFPRQGRSSASEIMEVEHCAGCNGAATASAGCAIKDGIMTATMDINRERIAATEAVIRPHIRRTPLVEGDLADFGLPASPVIFKLELLQHSGSFKARGAFANLLLRRRREAGVVAAAGANPGAGVAYAAQRRGVPATIFVPDITSPAKAERIRGYGAQLVVAG